MVKNRYCFLLAFCLSIFTLQATTAQQHNRLMQLIGNKRVTAVEGSAHELIVSSILKPEQVLVVNNFTDAISLIVNNKSDYLICSNSTSKTLLQYYSNIEVKERNVMPFGCSFGVNHQQSSLLKELNLFIDSLQNSGQMEAIVHHWVDSLELTSMPAIHLDPHQPTLVVASPCAAVPFSFIRENKPVGIEIEILWRFCQATHRNIQIKILPMGSIVAAVKMDQIDVVANCLYETIERSRVIAFSNIYCNANSVLMGRKQQHAGIASPMQRVKQSIEFNVLNENRYILILKGMGITVKISFLAILLGTLGGIVVCLGFMSKHKGIRYITNLYVNILNGMPLLVLLMLNFYVLFAHFTSNAMLVATISFAIYFSAFVGRMLHITLKNIDKGQYEAGRALGLTKVQTYWHILIPQTIEKVLPIYKGAMVSLIKMTSIVGFIAIQDITKVCDIVRSRTFDAFFPLIFAAILYFIVAAIFVELLKHLAAFALKKRI